MGNRSPVLRILSVGLEVSMLCGVWERISQLRTEVKYISSTNEYKEFEIGEYKILVENGELHLDYL